MRGNTEICDSGTGQWLKRRTLNLLKLADRLRRAANWWTNRVSAACTLTNVLVLLRMEFQEKKSSSMDRDRRPLRFRKVKQTVGTKMETKWTSVIAPVVNKLRSGVSELKAVLSPRKSVFQRHAEIMQRRRRYFTAQNCICFSSFWYIFVAHHFVTIKSKKKQKQVWANKNE